MGTLRDKEISKPKLEKSHASNEPAYVHTLAGAFAGMIADGIVHPIDTVRARLQIQVGAQSPGTFKTFCNILTKEGWRALYKGFGIVVAFTTPAHALYFVGYEGGKKYLSPSKPLDQKGPVVHFTAGFIAEVMGALVWTPMDVVKQRLQVQKMTHLQTRYKNSFHGILTVFRQEGIRGLYRGFTAGLATYGPFVGIYFVCYEQLKRFFGKLHHTHPEKLPFYAHLVSGFVSGAVAAATTCPLDVIKTRMQVVPIKEGGYRNFIHAFRSILRNESIR